MTLNWSIILPIIALQLLLQVIALVDLFKQDHLNKNKKIIWVLVILLFNLLGPIVYFVIGRRD